MQKTTRKLAFIVMMVSLGAASSIWAVGEEEKKVPPSRPPSPSQQSAERLEQWKRAIARNPGAMSLLREEASRGNLSIAAFLTSLTPEDTSAPPDILLFARDGAGYHLVCADGFLNAAKAAGAQEQPHKERGTHN